MAYLISVLAWPLLLLALVAGVAGWCWHCIRTAAATKALVEARDDARAALIDFYEKRPLVVLSASEEADRIRELERMLADAQREKTDLVALTDTLRAREEASRTLKVEADAAAARVAELEAKLADRSEVATLQARIAEMETQPAAAPSAPVADPGEQWRTRYLQHRLSWAEGRIDRAARPGADPDALAALTAERDAARAEAEQLKTQLSMMRAPAPVTPDQDRMNLLDWRNRYLDGRVRYLEGVVTAPTTLMAAAPAAEPAVDPEDARRAKWRDRYTTARIAYLEERERALTSAAAAAPASNPAELEAVRAEATRWREAHARLEAEAKARLTQAAHAVDERQGRIAALERDLAVAMEMASEADVLRGKLKELEAQQAQAIDPVEMTRARWKARYLDQRVKYLEERLTEITSKPAPTPTPAAALQPEAPAPVLAPVEPAAPQPAMRAPDPETSEPRYVWRRVRVLDEPPPPAQRERLVWRRMRVADDAPAPAPIAKPAPQPAAAAPTRAARPAPAPFVTIADRPPGLPGPRGGAPDDLRMIAGVGPKIESTLHSLGIYHFDQIAAWAPGHVAWIDQYMAFRGRVARENWIEQAAALARGEETEGKRRYLQGEHV